MLFIIFDEQKDAKWEMYDATERVNINLLRWRCLFHHRQFLVATFPRFAAAHFIIFSECKIKHYTAEWSSGK